MTPEAFWARVEKTPGCWLWTGARKSKGYGQTDIGGGRREAAHRYAYRTTVGPIPAGLGLDHLCHNADLTCPGGPACLHRRCVNPAHLEPVTEGENIRRGKGRITHCPKGHPLSGDNLKVDKRGYRSCRRCRADRQIAADKLTKRSHARKRLLHSRPAEES